MHLKSAYLLLLFLLLALGLPTQANTKKVYVHKDENGVMVFSDKPHSDAKEVKINKKPAIMPSTDTGILEQLQTQDALKPVIYQIAVNQPDDQTTIRDNEGVVYISGQVTPSFRFDHKIRLKLDGKPWQKPHSKAVFILRNIDRGEHTIVLELINMKNQVVATSKPRTFYLFRSSAIKAN